MQAYDSCRLIHINFTSFVMFPFTKDAQINFAKLYEVCYKAMILADDLIDLEIEAIDRILEKLLKDPENSIEEYRLWDKIKQQAQLTRRCGVGFTGLSDTIAMLGLNLKSFEAKHQIDVILETKLNAEINCTIDLALTRGKCPAYDKSLEYNDCYIGQNEFFRNLEKLIPFETLDRMQRFGRRNLSWSTVAPTGTVSIMAGVSSGIEPIFSPYYMRRKRCSTPSDRVDFVNDMGEKFSEFLIIHPVFQKYVLDKLAKDAIILGSLDVHITKELLDREFISSPWYGSTAPELSWEDRLDIQEIVQTYTTHSISSTINLPEDTSEEVISNIYKGAWLRKLKGVTVYRDNCRQGILNNIGTTEVKQGISKTKAPKRPKVLPAELHVVTSRGIRYAVIVGLLLKDPYEVFAFELDPALVVENHSGTITKIKKGQYEFKSIYVTITNLELATDKIEERACTLYSSMLMRHGAEMEFIISTARKVNEGITTFTSAMCRVLSRYMPKKEVKGEQCPECGASLVHEAGCVKCNSCTYSKCLILINKNK